MSDLKKILKNIGRPGLYDSAYHPSIGYRLCTLGLTDEELAFIFGISKQTVNEWKNQHEEFSKSIQRGKAIADAKVAHSLYKLANGYDKVETSTFEVQVAEHESELRSIDIVKHYPPDITACELWLRNRTNFFSQRKRNIDLVKKDFPVHRD